MLVKILQKISILCLTLVMVNPVMAKQPMQGKSSLPTIHRWQTPNGMQVNFVHVDKLPTLEVAVAFKAGAAADAEQPGIANYVNSMLGFFNTKHADTQQLAKQLDSIGAVFNAEMNFDSAVYKLTTLTDPEYLQPAINIYSQILTEPEFTVENFAKIKQEVLEAIKFYADSQTATASTEYFKYLYPGHPYGHMPLGEAKDLEKISLADIKNFYAKYYTAKNAHMVLVGNLSLEQAKTIAEKFSKQLPIGKSQAKTPQAKPLAQPVNQKVKFKDAKQSTILIAAQGVNCHDPKFYAFSLGSKILGEGEQSRLYKDLRVKKQLSYDPRASFTLHQAGTELLISMHSTAKNPQAVIEKTQEVINDFIAKGPTNQELATAKQQKYLNYANLYASNQELAYQLARFDFCDLLEMDESQYKQNIAAVTKQDIQSVFKEIFQTGGQVNLVIGA